MPKYIIHPIPVSEGIRGPEQYTFRGSLTDKVKMTCYAWYIEGPGQKIMVDTGATAAQFQSRGATQTDVMSVQDGLARFGVKPKDIDTVIVTHLHSDHIEQSCLFPKARFIVQKKEHDYAMHPHPVDAANYSPRNWEDIHLEIIEGTHELFPGISVFLTPGHTVGGQSVAIDTSAGKAIITGFCCALSTFVQTEPMKKRGWEVSLPQQHIDVREAYDSVLLVKRTADIIIATHDQAYMKMESIP